MKIVDTTAHTLAATLGFLALHEDIQEEVYEQITSVVGSDRDPVCVVQVFSSVQNPHSFWLLKVFDDYPKLDKVLGVFYEAVRMFRSFSHPRFHFLISLILVFNAAAGHIMIREAYEDTVLHIPKPHGQEGVTTVPIPKGLQVRTSIR